MSVYKEVINIIDKKNNFDIVDRIVELELKKYHLVFFSSLTSEDRLIELIKSLKKIKFKNTYIYKINNTQVDKMQNINEIVNKLYEGEAILFITNLYALRIDVRMYPSRSVSEPEAEKAIRGSKDGFNESLATNIALIRRRIKSSDLKIESFVVSKYSKTNVALLYLDSKIQDNVKVQLENLLTNVNLNSLIMSDRSLEEYMFKQNKCLYPLVRYTERPDIASIHLINGKAIILVDTSSSAIITPVSIFDHMRHVEEFRQTPIVGSFTRILRMISILLSLFLVPTFLCMLSKTSLTNIFSVATSKSSSFSEFAQALIGTIILEIFRIAIVHTPSPLVSAISLVSAVILGQVSMDIGIFSPEILLFVCIASTCGFATPSYELSLVNKLVQIIFIILAWKFGIPGLVLGALALFIYLVKIKVLNIPYLYPFCPFDSEKIKFAFIRPSSENKKNV